MVFDFVVSESGEGKVLLAQISSISASRMPLLLSLDFLSLLLHMSGSQY